MKKVVAMMWWLWVVSVICMIKVPSTEATCGWRYVRWEYEDGSCVSNNCATHDETICYDYCTAYGYCYVIRTTTPPSTETPHNPRCEGTDFLHCDGESCVCLENMGGEYSAPPAWMSCTEGEDCIDEDGDGINDIYEPQVVPDLDQDGIPDDYDFYPDDPDEYQWRPFVKIKDGEGEVIAYGLETDKGDKFTVGSNNWPEDYQVHIMIGQDWQSAASYQSWSSSGSANQGVTKGFSWGGSSGGSTTGGTGSTGGSTTGGSGSGSGSPSGGQPDNGGYPTIGQQPVEGDTDGQLLEKIAENTASGTSNQDLLLQAQRKAIENQVGITNNQQLQLTEQRTIANNTQAIANNQGVLNQEIQNITNNTAAVADNQGVIKNELQTSNKKADLSLTLDQTRNTKLDNQSKILEDIKDELEKPDGSFEHGSTGEYEGNDYSQSEDLEIQTKLDELGTSYSERFEEFIENLKGSSFLSAQLEYFKNLPSSSDSIIEVNIGKWGNESQQKATIDMTAYADSFQIMKTILMVVCGFFCIRIILLKKG